MRGSVITGTVSGAGVGLVTGAIVNQDNRGSGALIGGIVGAAIGAITGFFTHKAFETRDDQVRKETLFNLDKFSVQGPPQSSGNILNSGRPNLSSPVVESDWVETHVEGKKLIEGHRIWRITEESQWLPEVNTKK